jgi:hypothetical protein
VKIVEIGPAERAEWGPRVQELEATTSYPLGDDSFRIDHGADYFAFFERLGALRSFAAVDGDDVLAVGAAVMRRVPLRSGSLRRAWYLCDLKAGRDRRGRDLALRLLAHAFWRCYWRCPRGYAISMNPAGGARNPVARLLGRFRLAPLAHAGSLAIFALTPAQFLGWHPLLVAHRGAAALISLAGKKDLILARTGAPMALCHVHFGSPAAHEHVAPETLPADATCMVCAPDGDALAVELGRRGAALAGTATILAHRLQSADWRFILTSEI